MLAVDKLRKKPGAPRKGDRGLFNGLIWLARTGGQWAAIPRRYGAKSTIHDRFQEWVAHGCFEKGWALLLERYDGEVGLRWDWQAADGCIVKAPLGKRGGPARRRRPGPTPPTGASAGASGTR